MKADRQIGDVRAIDIAVVLALAVPVLGFRFALHCAALLLRGAAVDAIERLTGRVPR